MMSLKNTAKYNPEPYVMAQVEPGKVQRRKEKSTGQMITTVINLYSCRDREKY